MYLSFIGGRCFSNCFLWDGNQSEWICTPDVQEQKPQLKKRCLLFRRKATTNLDSVLKMQKYHFAHKGPYNQSCGFSSSHGWMWELNCKEGWSPTNWCFWIVVLEKTLQSPLDNKEIKPVNPKGKQSCIFIGRTDAEAEAPILWPPDAKNQLIAKRPWCWERSMAKGEGDSRAWDGWMASSAQCTWV